MCSDWSKFHSHITYKSIWDTWLKIILCIFRSGFKSLCKTCWRSSTSASRNTHTDSNTHSCMHLREFSNVQRQLIAKPSTIDHIHTHKVNVENSNEKKTLQRKNETGDCCICCVITCLDWALLGSARHTALCRESCEYRNHSLIQCHSTVYNTNMGIINI